MVEDEKMGLTKENKAWLTQFVDWAVKLLIVGIASLLYQMHNSQNEIIRKLDQNDVRISALEKDITVIRGQMVGWDVLTRVERTLGLLSATGKGNIAMGAVSDVLRAERESRESKAKSDGGRQ
jgi:hypothetical protein